MLVQEDDDKNETVVYNLSKRFHDYETRYTPIEKSCFTLVWAIQKLRHILLPFQIWVVARMDPLKTVKMVDPISRIRFEVCGKEDYQGECRV